MTQIKTKIIETSKGEWKPIQGYEGLYQVSSIGNVRSLDRKIIRTSSDMRIFGKSKCLIDFKGYKTVDLYNKGKSKRFMVHRLVLMSFCPQPDLSLDVNHINGIKSDNRVENLEWCTRSDNLKHAFRTGLKTNIGIKQSEQHVINRVSNFYKRIGQYTLDGSLVKVWDYGKLVDKYGFVSSKVSQCCNGKRKTHKNFKWKFI